jgi:hypothetical protein
MENTNTLTRALDNPAIDRVAEPLSKGVRSAYAAAARYLPTSRLVRGRQPSRSMPPPTGIRACVAPRRSQWVWA